jgi:hypothetical protein
MIGNGASPAQQGSSSDPAAATRQRHEGWQRAGRLDAPAASVNADCTNADQEYIVHSTLTQHGLGTNLALGIQP